jgi:hypothetical protein
MVSWTVVTNASGVPGTEYGVRGRELASLGRLLVAGASFDFLVDRRNAGIGLGPHSRRHNTE